MAVRPGRLSRGSPLATGLAALLLLGGILGGLFAQGYIRGRDREIDELRIEADARRLEAVLGELVARTALLAELAPQREAFVRTARAATVAEDSMDVVVVLSSDGRRVISLLGPERLSPFGSASTGVVADAVEASVATGQPRLAGPVRVGDVATVVAVAPVPPEAPDGIAARRAATTAVVATATRLQLLLTPPREVPLWPGGAVAVVSPDDRVGVPPDDVVDTVAFEVAGSPWEVSVGPLRGQKRLLGWWVAAIGAVAAAVVHVALRRSARHRAEAREEAAQRARQLQAIAETSTTLQQSLDLAELLPAFCVNLVERLDVSAVSVLVVSEPGDLVEAFRYGTALPGDVVTAIDLRRGWSRVGQLHLSARRPLDEPSARSLEALADLLGVAISNAQLYRREQQAVTRLSELDALKNAFLGTVSHELRTSTTAVQGFGDLLDGHWDALPEERKRELARRIKRQAGSLRHLVDDLLDYARLEHHSLRVTPREQSLTDLVRQISDSMAPLVEDHEVVVDAPEDVRAWVDPIAVERITANLLSNAGKYSPAGTTITVRVDRDGDRARLQVCDQGPGIPAEERRRIFVRFYRLDNAETLRTRGAGIGLSILHDFAERSSATVTIDDAPGGGARFTVAFPTVPVEAAPALAGGAA